MYTPIRACALVLLLLVAPIGGAAAQSANDSSATGRRVDFELTPFQDTLFTAIDGVLRARFDDAGQIWYTTEGGVVHVDATNGTRELFTKVEGLPSSYSMGLAVGGGKVYVGTDLGLAVIDRATGAITPITMQNSAIPDTIIQEVTLVGDQVWLGTRFEGVAIWDTTKPHTDASAWTFRNTSTTTDIAKPVRRIVPSASAVYVATEGDGLWRFDRASKTWNVTVKADGLPANEVTAVAERAGSVWIGTTRGLAVRDAAGTFTYYNKTVNGMPDDRVNDLDVIPTQDGTLDVFAATRGGLWQLEPASGRNATRAQAFGILGTHLFDSEFSGAQGWLFASTRGVSMLRNNEWKYFATGPTTGPTWGPLSFGFTSASVGDQNGFLWFGSANGLSAYRLPGDGHQGYWQNFGEWQNYPGTVVNWVDTDGNVTWFATNQGVYGFEQASGRWIPKIMTESRNLVYGMDADRGELWIGLFGDGLVMENLTTGVVRSWDHRSAVNAIPDIYITDVRVDDSNVWLGAGIGMMRLDRATGTLRGTYTQADGLPGTGVVFRVEPEGAHIWVGMKEGGVAKLDVASGKVSSVWNATTTPGFPGGQVRSFHREGSNLWIGTSEGLARLDVNTGIIRAWSQSNSDLVQNFVNGITSAQGLLYLATLSGVQRMEIDTGKFLPMRDGPGVVRVSAEAAAASPTRLTVRVDGPRDRTAVTGPTQIHGSALAFGARVDRVEIRVGDDAYVRANGTESWSFDWNADAHPANSPVTIRVRAFSGDLTGETQISLTPVAAPTIPLHIEEIEPTDAYANRPLRLAARAEGDEPLSVNAYYRAPGSASFTRLEMTRSGGLFTVDIPARNMREGDLRYYLEAQSGLLLATAAGDASNPTTLHVAPAPRLAVALDGPPLVQATAGTEMRFDLNITNAGTQPATFTVRAAGLRSAWVSVPANDLELAPGETRQVSVRLLVPAAAFADNTTLSFEARDATGSADPSSVSVPLRILADPSSPTPRTSSAPPAPVPLAPWLALAAIGAALVLRRRAA